MVQLTLGQAEPPEEVIPLATQILAVALHDQATTEVLRTHDLPQPVAQAHQAVAVPQEAQTAPTEVIQALRAEALIIIQARAHLLTSHQVHRAAQAEAPIVQVVHPVAQVEALTRQAVLQAAQVATQAAPEVRVVQEARAVQAPQEAVVAAEVVADDNNLFNPIILSS